MLIEGHSFQSATDSMFDTPRITVGRDSNLANCIDSDLVRAMRERSPQEYGRHMLPKLRFHMFTGGSNGINDEGNNICNNKSISSKNRCECECLYAFERLQLRKVLLN